MPEIGGGNPVFNEADRTCHGAQILLWTVSVATGPGCRQVSHVSLISKTKCTSRFVFDVALPLLEMSGDEPLRKERLMLFSASTEIGVDFDHYISARRQKQTET